MTCHDSQSVLLFGTTNNSNNRTTAMETMDRYDHCASPTHKDSDIYVWRLLHTDTHGKQWITKFVRGYWCYKGKIRIGMVSYELGGEILGTHPSEPQSADRYEYPPREHAVITWRLLVHNWCAKPITFSELETLELKYYGLAR